MTNITRLTLMGSTADTHIDETTRLFRCLADRGDGKGGAADGKVSLDEAMAYIADAEAVIAKSGDDVKKDGKLSSHEMVYTLNHELKKLENSPKSISNNNNIKKIEHEVEKLRTSIISEHVKYDQKSIENALKKPENASLLAQRDNYDFVAAYGNVLFAVPKNQSAQKNDATAFVKKAITDISKTDIGFFALDELNTQYKNTPLLVRLNGDALPEENSMVESGNYFSEKNGSNFRSIEDENMPDIINLHYNYASVYTNSNGKKSEMDAIGILFHETSHALGSDSDIKLAKKYLASTEKNIDTNKNGMNDALEFKKVIGSKSEKDVVSDWVSENKSLNFWNAENSFDNPYTEHVAVFFEQIFFNQSGRSMYRNKYEDSNGENTVFKYKKSY
jgi:hypothetical protein